MNDCLGSIARVSLFVKQSPTANANLDCRIMSTVLGDTDNLVDGAHKNNETVAEAKKLLKLEYVTKLDKGCPKIREKK